MNRNRGFVGSYVEVNDLLSDGQGQHVGTLDVEDGSRREVFSRAGWGGSGGGEGGEGGEGGIELGDIETREVDGDDAVLTSPTQPNPVLPPLSHRLNSDERQ